MTTFGFSAFLKLLSLNPKPQRWQVGSRLGGGTGGGYDFHRSLRLRIRRHLVGGESIDDVVASAEDIVPEPEKRSVKAGLAQLASWREANPGEVLSFGPATYEAPSGLFKVSFIPDFGLAIDGQRTAIHVWNTGAPKLDDNMVYAALSLLPIAYASHEQGPGDFAVLSLVDGRLYRLSDRRGADLIGGRVVARLEEVFRDVLEELRLPRQPPDKRPAR